MIVANVLLVACFLLPAAAAALYHVLLLAARLCGARAVAPASEEASHSFAIIIPAHNEEQGIVEVIRSCTALDYPAEKYQVFVVADNCSDRTAEVARACGATCLERTDARNAGKGHALQWAFEQILPRGLDAVVVLDADCTVESHALRVFDRCLQEGSRTLQAHYVLSNPDASPISYVARVGNVLEYEYFYAPKSDLGLAVMLVGTGMVFHRSVLLEFPWRAHSVVEDAEYTLTLARHGLRVRFVANVHVVQAAAERVEQLAVQRARWASGTWQLGKRSAIGLIANGLLTGRVLLADAGWTLLIVSRPLVLLHLSLTLVAAALVAWQYPASASWLYLATGWGLFALYAAYFGFGIAKVGFSARRASFLLSAPLVLARLAVIAVRSGISRRAAWIRTPRS
jgi:hypothetical protein